MNIGAVFIRCFSAQQTRDYPQDASVELDRCFSDPGGTSKNRANQMESGMPGDIQRVLRLRGAHAPKATSLAPHPVGGTVIKSRSQQITFGNCVDIFFTIFFGP